MNSFTAPWAQEITVFHVRMGGCAGCGLMVDTLLRDGFRGTPRLVECDSPRHAYLLVVTGFWTGELSGAALNVISQAPVAHRLLVVGDCALGRGPLAAKVDDVTRHLEPDREVDGCPVTLESLVKGVRDVDW